MKATKELISEVLRKRIAACTKEELSAVLKLVGLSVKEYSSIEMMGEIGQYYTQTSFELHHRIYYCMGIEGQTNIRSYSYHNEWLQENGYSIPTENVAEMINIMLNMWIPRLPFDFEGPEYNEIRDYEYDSVEELKELLNHLQQEMESVTPSSKEKKPSMDLSEEELSGDDDAKSTDPTETTPPKTGYAG
jgi:antitoxin component of RelBE/YafQ-DinJ toxin-antitoxin module